MPLFHVRAKQSTLPFMLGPDKRHAKEQLCLEVVIV